MAVLLLILICVFSASVNRSYSLNIDTNIHDHELFKSVKILSKNYGLAHEPVEIEDKITVFNIPAVFNIQGIWLKNIFFLFFNLLCRI